jgi:hypothetical protein
MIVVRTVFQAQFGKGGELAARMAEGNRQLAEEMGRQLGGQRRWRILTDLSGGFDTVVFEVEGESLAEWERARALLFQLPAFRESMAQTQGLIVGGRNELWTIEAEG